MRLLLLPISTRRALIYCEPPSHSLPNTQQNYLDKAVTWASKTWAGWEKTESGWKLKTTQYGNRILRRIPFEEWGLKSIPTLKEKRLKEYADNPSKMAVNVIFPGRYQALSKHSVLEELKHLGADRLGLHKSRLLWTVAAMPLTIPFAAIPVVPNLPFLYLCFRAYSHWRAKNGSLHLSHLVNNNLLSPTPDSTLDTLYSAGLLHATRADSRNAEDPTIEQTEKIAKLIKMQTRSIPINSAGTGADLGASPDSVTGPQVKLKKGAKATKSDDNTKGGKAEGKEQPGDGRAPEEDDEEIMLLKGWNGKLIAERLGLPGLEVEIERAVEQVENQLKKGEELREEKKEIETAVGPGKDKVSTREKGS